VEEVDNSPQKTACRAILGIYAKQPLPGQCKTRLSPPLSPAEAAALYQCCLVETVSRMQAVGGCDLAICYAGERSWFEREFPDITLQPQRGPDLGARMAGSLCGFLQQGYHQAILIGSDTPDLPLPLVAQAFAALQQVELVLAPATDGGYVLIGESVHRPELFEAIHWSTDTVLAETLRRAERYGIVAETLGSWEDLDDPRSLLNLLRRSPKTRTARYLQQHLSHIFTENS